MELMGCGHDPYGVGLAAPGMWGMVAGADRIDAEGTGMAQERTTAERLLDAALAVYLERGWQGASLAAIAARVGLTTGAIYAHFKGKNELFVEVLDAQFRRMAVELRGRLAGVETARERLAVLRGWFRERRRRAGVRLIYDLWHQAAEYPRVRRALAQSYERATADVAAALEHELGRALAALGVEAKTLAIASTALMEGLMLRQFLTGSDESVDLVFDLLERLALPLVR